MSWILWHDNDKFFEIWIIPENFPLSHISPDRSVLLMFAGEVSLLRFASFQFLELLSPNSSSLLVSSWCRFADVSSLLRLMQCFSDVDSLLSVSSFPFLHGFSLISAIKIMQSFFRWNIVCLSKNGLNCNVLIMSEIISPILKDIIHLSCVFKG